MEPEKAKTWLDVLFEWAKKLASGSWRARVNFSLLLVMSLAAAFGAGFLSDKNWMPAGIAFGIASIFFIILVIRLRREATVDLPKLKGASPFGPADGELFSGLGRGGDVRDLVDAVLSGDKAVVFVFGQ